MPEQTPQQLPGSIEQGLAPELVTVLIEVGQALVANLSTNAVLAAALRPERFCAVTANELPDSYLAIYERGLDHLLWQQSFCFGLLEVADILHIVSLMDGVELRRPGRCLPPHRPPGGKR